MKLLTTACGLSAALAIVWAATGQELAKDQAKKDPVKKQFAELDGTWTLIKMEIEGKSLLKKNEPESKFVIKDGKVTSDAKEAPEGDMELSKILDPSKKPNQITVPNFEGGDPKKSVTLIGIYELNGDELRVCVEAVETANLRERAKERPTAFDSKQGLLLVFKRERKDKKDGDMERIQGTWIVDPATYAEVKEEVTLKEVLKEIKSMQLIFEGDTFTINDAPAHEERGRFLLDQTKKPKQIDMSEGIYELNGDTLKLCWDQQAKTNCRPTKFSLRQEKDSVHYCVLKRDNPKKAVPKKEAESIAYQDRTIAAIKELGGLVLIDRGTDSTSTVKVILSETRVKDKDLEQLQGLPALQELYLFRTKLSGKGLKHLKGLTRLQKLDLSHCTELTEAGLTNLKDLTKLQTLDLTNSGIRDGDLKHIKNLTDLQALYLRINPKITDTGLEELKGLTKLQTLVLDNTEITDAGIKHLKGLTKLRTLHLACKLTDASLEQLKGFTDLRSLSLWGTQATDAGLVNLKGLTDLEGLFLVGTQVTDAGLVNLKGLTKLHTLDLRLTKTTERGVKSLKQSLPKLKVISAAVR